MKLVPRAKFQQKTRDFEPDSFVQYRLEVKNHVFTIFPELLSLPLISPILSLCWSSDRQDSFLCVRGRPPESLLQLFNKWTALNDFFFRTISDESKNRALAVFKPMIFKIEDFRFGQYDLLRVLYPI